MPLLSTFGAGSARGFGRGGKQKLVKFAETSFFAAPNTSGNLVLSSDKDIQDKDVILVWQLSASNSYTTKPSPAAKIGTGFSYRGGVSQSNVVGNLLVGSWSSKICDGTEAGTTIGGFMVEGDDGYGVVSSQAYLLRANFNYSTLNGYDSQLVSGGGNVGEQEFYLPSPARFPMPSGSGPTITAVATLRNNGPLTVASYDPEFSGTGAEFKQTKLATGSSAKSDSGFRNEHSVFMISQAAGLTQQLTITTNTDSNTLLISSFGPVLEFEE